MNQWAKALRSGGLTVAEAQGWTERGNGHMGHITSNSAIQGIMCVSPDSDAHVSVDASGVCHLLAAHRVDHAGQAKSARWAGFDGDRFTLAIKLDNASPGAMQIEAYAHACAALLRCFELPVWRVLDPEEYAPGHGKSGVEAFGGVLMLRARVQAARFGQPFDEARARQQIANGEIE